MKHLVFVLGTGRCGTMSAAKLLSAQPDTKVHHESNPRPSWKDDEPTVEKKLNDFLRRPKAIIGDAGFYYLPYVRFILERVPETVFICLKRDREETVDSYMEWTRGRNFWMEHNGKYWKRYHRWDRCFPKYECEALPNESLPLCKRRAIAMYWDEYYQQALELEELLNGKFRVFPTHSLNSENGVRAMLTFAGVPENSQVPRVGIRRHQRKNKNMNG